MKRLEEIAGPPALFVRSGRRMIMTPRAESVLIYARKVLFAHNEMAAMLNVAGAGGTVRLGSPEDYMGSLLPPALDRFACRYPGIAIDVVCETSEILHRQLTERKIDLAVVTKGALTRENEILRFEPLVWVASAHHNPEREAVVPMALFQPGCASRALAIETCKKAGVRHRVAYSSPSLSGLLAVVRQGLAVAALAKCSAPQDMRILTAEDGMPRLPELSISMLRSETTLNTPFVEALATEIRSALASPSSAMRDRASHISALS